MKKGAMKASGILTLILYILLFVVAAFIAGNYFNIEFIAKLVTSNEILLKILLTISYIFVEVPCSLILKVVALDAALIKQVLIILFLVFSAFMIFWGAKEISVSKLDDSSFARRKKTFGFMMFLKCAIFVFFAAYAVLAFVFDEVSAVNTVIGTLLNVENIFAYVLIFLAVYSLLIFLLPTINLAKAGKFIEEDAQVEPQSQPADQPEQPSYNFGPQVVQANMPPIAPNFQSPQGNPPPNQFSQPQMQQPGGVQQPTAQPTVQPQAQQPNVQPQAQAGGASAVVPGQNGVPQNITPKGIADLERLERLKNSGAITPDNYNAMRAKIINTNLG